MQLSHKKKLIRVLHTSDIHLGGYGSADGYQDDHKAERVLTALVSFSLQAKTNLVIIAGDLFDHNRVDDATVKFALAELRKAAVPVIILPGNHDCLVSDSVYRRVCFSKLAPNVRVFTAEEGQTFSFPDLDLAVWGKPITSYGGNLRPLADTPLRGGARWQIAVAHGYYVGTQPSSLDSFQINEGEILTSDRDYVALGHVPVFRPVCNGPVKAFYSGSPAETGSVVIVDFACDIGVEVHRHPISV